MKKLLIFMLFVAVATSGFTMGNMINEPQDSSMVYDFPEKMAKYPGGADAMDLFIRRNLVYPEDLKSAGVQGKVYVQFIVEKDGSITNITVRRSSRNERLDQEAVKVIEKMPNWVPGMVRGKKVRVKQTVPIQFVG